MLTFFDDPSEMKDLLARFSDNINRHNSVQICKSMYFKELPF